MSKRLLSTGALLAVLLAACNSELSSQQPLVQKLPVIAGTGSAEPHLARAGDGTVVMSWLEGDDTQMSLRAAALRDGAWQTPVTIASGDNWLVNWADFPSVEPIDDNLWAAHWLVRTPGGSYSYNVAIAVSNDAGRTWSDPLTPHDDNTATEHGFVSLFPWQGAIGALWLDGRNMVGDGHGDQHAGGMTLRSAMIGADGAIIRSQLIDELVCDCCQTDVALGQHGPIAVYRNRSESEIRDIHVVRAIDGQWQTNTPVADDGWTINACPVNGPAIASRDGLVAVAWFTASNDDSKLLMAWSNDDGGTFAAPIEVDIDRPVGRADIELLEDGSAVVSWLRSGADNHGEICLRQVSVSGELGPVQVVASTGANRASGFPQMLRDDDGLVIAWTDVSSDTTQVLTARIDAADL